MFGDDPLTRSLILVIVFQPSSSKVEAEALFCALHKVDQAFNTGPRPEVA